MKKYLLLFLCCCRGISIFAQPDSLYDVNYDSPVSSLSYTEDMQFFQEIYLQYESAINYIETKVREEEKSRYQAALERVKEEGQQELTDAVLKTRNDIYSYESEKIREQEIERLTAELTEQISAQLTAEYEKKKDTELAMLRIELERQIYQETNAQTDRIRIIALYGMICVLFLISIIIILSIVKNNKNCSQEIKRYKDKYLEELKKFQGHAEVLHDDIEKLSDKKDKTLRYRALKQAVKMYERRKNILPIEQLKQEFDNIYPKSIFSGWNGAGEDTELKNGLCNKFYAHINDFSQKAADVCSSLQLRSQYEQDIIISIFKSCVDILGNTAKQVNGLADQTENKKLKNSLRGIARDYKILAKKFKQRNF